jgi:hypothetical protein
VKESPLTSGAGAALSSGPSPSLYSPECVENRNSPKFIPTMLSSIIDHAGSISPAETHIIRCAACFVGTEGGWRQQWIFGACVRSRDWAICVWE